MSRLQTSKVETKPLPVQTLDSHMGRDHVRVAGNSRVGLFTLMTIKSLLDR